MVFLDFKNVYLCITALSLYKSGIIESLYTHPPRFISHKFPRQMTKSHRIDPDTHDTGNFVVSGMVVGYIFGCECYVKWEEIHNTLNTITQIPIPYNKVFLGP